MDLNELITVVDEARSDVAKIARDSQNAHWQMETLLRNLREEKAGIERELREHAELLRRAPCPHCNKCQVCGWDKHPCVCP